MGSIELVLPVEDGDIACGNAEAVDVLQREGRIGFAGAAIPISEALLASGLDGGSKIHRFHGIDVNGSQLIRLLTKDGIGGWAFASG